MKYSVGFSFHDHDGTVYKIAEVGIDYYAGESKTVNFGGNNKSVVVTKYFSEKYIDECLTEQ